MTTRFRLGIDPNQNTIYGDLDKWMFDSGDGTTMRFHAVKNRGEATEWYLVVSESGGIPEHDDYYVPFDLGVAGFLFDAITHCYGLSLMPEESNE